MTLWYSLYRHLQDKPYNLSSIIGKALKQPKRLFARYVLHFHIVLFVNAADVWVIQVLAKSTL